MKDLTSLSLFPATPEQTLESRKRTHAQWARGLSVDQYLERDKVMDLQEHADGKLITWVLAPRSDSTTLEFKCSCETFRRIAVVASPTSTSAFEVPGYGIASIYTPPQNRSKGYAVHMMRLLHWILAPRSSLPAFPAEWGIPPESPLQDARFSVLYSDIGKEFYARAGPAPGQLGWVVTGALSTQWAVPPQAATAVDQSQWKWFSRDECIDLWKQDAELIKSDVVALAKKGQTVHTFLPDKGVGQFSIQRLMTFDEDLKPVYPPEPWGVRLRASKGLTFATWTFELGTKTMVLTRLRSTAEDLPALLEALKFKAQEMSFDTVETWDIPQELKDVGDQLGARTFEREEHLSAAKWYGPEPVDQLEWVFNEKFCWC